VGACTERIYLTGATDVDAGASGIYDLGKVDKKSVGLYRLVEQGAASVTAEPLGTQLNLEFELVEASAGVFTVAEAAVVGPVDRATDTTVVAVADAVLDGAGSDSRVTVFVATAADVTDAAAWTAAKTLKVGHLYILDALAAAVHVFKIRRMN
jgi:hypothetical protein